MLEQLLQKLLVGHVDGAQDGLALALLEVVRLQVGGIERAGIYTTLIRERTPLDTIDFALIREKPQLMAFSRAERAHRLGGVTK